MRLLSLIISCLTLTGAVSDTERVEVKSGENFPLIVENPGDVRVAMLTKCENMTGHNIIRYCSPEEETGGCTAKKADRLSIKCLPESLSVSFVDARVDDEGCYVISYIDKAGELKTKSFNVTVYGSQQTDAWTISLEQLNIIAVGIGVFTAVVILAIVGVISCICQKSKQNNAGDDAGGAKINSTSSGAGNAADETLKMVDETKCSADNNNQQEEEMKDLNHDDRKRMTDKTGRTRP